MGDIVVGGYIQGPPEKACAVTPGSEVGQGAKGETHEDESSGGRKEDLPVRPGGERCRDSPDHGDEQTDQGDIGIAIRPALGTNLKQANLPQLPDLGELITAT